MSRLVIVDDPLKSGVYLRVGWCNVYFSPVQYFITEYARLRARIFEQTCYKICTVKRVSVDILKTRAI